MRGTFLTENVYCMGLRTYRFSSLCCGVTAVFAAHFHKFWKWAVTDICTYSRKLHQIKSVINHLHNQWLNWYQHGTARSYLELLKVEKPWFLKTPAESWSLPVCMWLRHSRTNTKEGLIHSLLFPLFMARTVHQVRLPGWKREISPLKGQRPDKNSSKMSDSSHITHFLPLPARHGFLSDSNQELGEDVGTVEAGNSLLEIQEVLKTLTGDDKKGKR